MKKLLLLGFIIGQQLLDAQTQAHLDINNVKALILNRNDMFWNPTGGAPAYEVPKNSGKHCNFVNSVWIGGLDAGSQLHTAGMTYRQNGFDFWPGPLDTINAAISSSVSASFDKVWKINASDINAFIASAGNPTYTIPQSIMTWPGNGDPSQNQAAQLAPYVDVNNDGFYDPTAGDYPKIKGDQMIYYIVNDKLSTHSETQGAPLGIEMHVSAYAYGCPNVTANYPELQNTTFYHYKIINRSSFQYNNVMLSIFSDADLGIYSNDYIGCDISDHLAYIYNATPSDGMYGNYPPITSYQILKGPQADAMDGIDNNGDGTIDEAMEDCRFNGLMFYNNNLGSFPPMTTNPSLASHYYGYMNSLWKNNTSLKADSSGYLSATSTVQATKFAYPGDPQSNTGWTEFTRNNLPGDRRLLINNGPFTLKPNAVHDLEFSILTTFDSTANGHKNISKVKTQNAAIKNFYNLTNKPVCSLTMGIEESEKIKQQLFLTPNPASSEIIISAGTQLNGYELKMYNATGQIVLKKNISGRTETIAIEELPNGIYFVEVKGGNYHATGKLVKN